MTVDWHHYSDNPGGLTSYFDDPPQLQNVVIREFDGSAYFNQYSFRLWFDLPIPPKSLPDGSTFSVGLYFMHLHELRLSTTSSDKLTTTLTVSRAKSQLIHVCGKGEVNIDLVCKSFMIESVAKSNSDVRAKITRNLSSYHQLWNSCLIELVEMGYELAIRGYPDADGGTGDCSFTATKDSVRLAGQNPVELVGLATMKSRFPDFDHESKIWQRPGPNLIQQLIQGWERNWCKPNS